MIETQEIWKPIPDFPGYEASNLGRIRSLPRTVFSRGNPDGALRKKSSHTVQRAGRILKPSRIRYERVSIGGKLRSVHALVLQAFVGPCPDGHIVCHGPGGSLDNRLSNLYYGTVNRNNGIDRIRDGTMPRGEKAGRAKLKNDDVVDIKQRLRDGQSRASISRLYGVNPETISHIAVGRTWAWLEA